MGPRNPELKEAVLKLRKQDRLSLCEIHSRTGVSKGTLSYWLKPYPLTKEERKALYAKGRGKFKYSPYKEESQHSKMVKGIEFTRKQKGDIAEAAVLFRLTLHRYITFGSPFDGDKADWLTIVPETGNIWRIQVRWCAKNRVIGAPFIPLKCCVGNRSTRRLRDDEFDFIVGYDLFTDTAYVFSSVEISKNKATISIRLDAAEAWHKLRKE